MDQNNPFTQDEIAAMTGEVESPIVEQAKPEALTKADLEATQAATEATIKQTREDLLRQHQELYRVVQPKEVNQPPLETLPKQISIDVDLETDKPYVPVDQVQKIVAAELKKFQQETIDPFIPAVRQTQQSMEIENATKFLKTQAPDLVEHNAPAAAQLFLGQLYSPLNPYPEMGPEKTQWAIEQLKAVMPAQGQQAKQDLPISTGASQALPAYNAVGRTQVAQHPGQFNFPAGSKIPVKLPEYEDVDQYMQATAQRSEYIKRLEDYNKKYNMGWTITTA